MGLKLNKSGILKQETILKQASEAVGKYNLVCVSQQARWAEAIRRVRRAYSKPLEISKAIAQFQKCHKR